MENKRSIQGQKTRANYARLFCKFVEQRINEWNDKQTLYYENEQICNKRPLDWNIATKQEKVSVTW